MELSREQQQAFELYLQGKNVFLTGAGGTGKSALIKKIYSHALSVNRKVQVTALTGCAAILLGCKACTLHSWAGIGLGTAPLEEILEKILKSRFKKANWIRTQVLIVDEVSMLSLKLFHLLDDLGRFIRRQTGRPFGGIQVIFSGDFFQLPPVGREDEPETMQFCFESPKWLEIFPYQVELQRIFRQDDQVYIQILNQIREGVIKKSANDILLSLTEKEKPADKVITKLFPKRHQVDAINHEKMEALEGDVIVHELTTSVNLPVASEAEMQLRAAYSMEEMQIELENMINNLLCDRLFLLKKGAQVMCIVNIKEEGVDILCNGSQGIVTGFCEITNAPIVRFNNGIIKTMHKHTWVSDKIPGIGISQVPLILAWALTIHKSQGSTLDTAEVDVGSGIFECGQTYVALSRVRNIEGLFLSSFDYRKIRVFKKVKDFYERMREQMERHQQQQQQEELERKRDPNVKVLKISI
jgi:ATP-dependent DNA helicase PIF1